MTAAERAYFTTEPVAHVARYDEVRRIARKQAEFRAAHAAHVRRDPRSAMQWL